jgi:thiol-disulfide isomerase/thioredoxin
MSTFKRFREMALDLVTISAASWALILLGVKGCEGIAFSPDVGPSPDRLIGDWERLAAGGHRSGPPVAQATITVFFDYQCPSCRRLIPTIEKAAARFRNDLAVVLRHWPLSYHLGAYPAARAAECAAAQGGFERFHQWLIKDSEWFQSPVFSFLEYAKTSEFFHHEEFERCASDREPHPKVDQDIAAAKSFGARGTPAVLVNGIYLGSMPDSAALDELIQEALRTGISTSPDRVGGVPHGAIP